MSNYPGNYNSQPGYNAYNGTGYQARPAAPGYQGGPAAAPGYQARPGAPGYQGGPAAAASYQARPGAPGYQAGPGAHAYQGMQGYQASPPGQQGAPGYTQGYQAPQGYQQQPTGYQQQAGYQGAPAGYASAPPSFQGGMPQHPPGTDPTLWNWFLTVDTDKSGEITANELKQALINGNWTHFNDETCRLMISLFDRDQSGTINFDEFCKLWSYIQQWKGLFESYDTDRSGAIEMNELKTALDIMGYRVSPNFVNLLIARFDTVARRSIKLDSFIQCCVMLRLLTDAFRLRDTNKNGVINVNYEDFMCMVIENKT